MQITWEISAEDVRKIDAVLCDAKQNSLTRDRKKRNLARSRPNPTKTQFWQQLTSMRLTSVQRSSPGSNLSKFLEMKPFPLRYSLIREQRHPSRFITRVIKKARAYRFPKKAGDELAYNLRILEDGEWSNALAQTAKLTGRSSKSVERDVARYVQNTFKGFGPKQSRNFLQALGLTRYEIPIDSRVTKWLNEFGFPVELSAAVLADRRYYEFVLDGIQELCDECEVYPCLLDAAIFTSYDPGEW